MATTDTKEAVRETRRFAGQDVAVSVVPRMPHSTYSGRVTSGIRGLLSGMRLTLGYFLRPAITAQYPENRATLRFPERYRAVLRLKFLPAKEEVGVWALPEAPRGHQHVKADILQEWMRGYKEVPYHKCTGCKNCEVACPNASITVITRVGEISEDRELDRFVWRMDSCMYCNACVQACPHDALEMGHEFENAVYDRRLLIYNLNPLSGPPAGFVLEEKEEARRQLVAPRALCGGPIPLNGTYLPNVKPLDVHPLVDTLPVVEEVQ